jgi:hypothetical protein
MAILILDIEAFKAEYSKLRSLHGNGVADIPPPVEDSEFTRWSALAHTKRRWSAGARVAVQARGSFRPTEHLAFARAAGLPVLDADFPHNRQDPQLVTRCCARCQRHKPLSAYAPRKAQHEKPLFGGLRWFCNVCRDDVANGRYRWTDKRRAA